MITMLDRDLISSKLSEIFDGFITLWKLSKLEFKISIVEMGFKEKLIYCLIMTNGNPINLQQRALEINVFSEHSIWIYLDEWRIKKDFNFKFDMNSHNYKHILRSSYSINKDKPGLRNFKIELESIDELVRFLYDFDRAL